MRVLPEGEGREAAINVRLEHVDALAELAKTTQAAVAALGQVFRHEGEMADEVRSAAGTKLRDLGAVNELVDGLRCDQENIHKTAAQMLGELGPAAASALPLLEARLNIAQVKTVQKYFDRPLREIFQPTTEVSIDDHGMCVYLMAIERIRGGNPKP